MKVLRDVFGCRHVDVVVMDMDLVKEKALNVRLNRHEGGWDDAGLAKLLRELSAPGG